MATNTEPKWHQDMTKAVANGDYVYANDGPYTFNDTKPNAVTIRCGDEDMIRCSPDGFWVRGIKVPQDDKEAEAVYNAFNQWLTWATLNDSR
jgi:hypothetical protein